MPKGRWIVFKVKRRPANYEDPPEVLARQFFYLERWKAQGKLINVPRIAWALAAARRWWEHPEYRSSERGAWMKEQWRQKQRSKGGKLRAQMPGYKEDCDKARASALRAIREKTARKRNPLALPEKPKKAGRRLAL